MLGAANGDPRATRWTSDSSIRPWFVFFDGDAATYVNNGYDTSFYSTNHYILIMTEWWCQLYIAAPHGDHSQ